MSEPGLSDDPVAERSPEPLSPQGVTLELWGNMGARERWQLITALGFAILYSIGTAALPMLIKLPQQDYHDIGFMHIAHWPLLLILTGVFLVRPIALRGHVRFISKSLKTQLHLDRSVKIGIAHYVLLVLTRDVPLLLLLCGALALNLGIWTIGAIAVVGMGLWLASRVVKRHRKKAQGKSWSAERGYLAMRNARADTEAMSDLPQSILIAGAVLWFGWMNEPFSGGLIASLIVNIMLASPPIRRLTKLYAKLALKSKNDPDDED